MLWCNDTTLRRTWADLVLHCDESFHVCVHLGPLCGNMRVGGGWDVLQHAAHQGPEFVPVEVFAQLKHHLLCHITEGCQQQNEGMRTSVTTVKQLQISSNL